MIRLALSATAFALVVTFVLFSVAGASGKVREEALPMSPMIKLSGELPMIELSGELELGSSSPPRAAVPRVPTAYARVLHGACCDPQSTCERLAAALPEGIELQCTTGNVECVGGGFDWRGDGEAKAAYLEQLPGLLQTAETTPNGDNLLIGFSRGAYVARDVALARPGRYSALVLIGATIALDVPALKAAGIKRVVLAAGEYDSSFKAMQRTRDKLALNGIEARFVPMGKIFHELPKDAGLRLRDAVAWASAPPSA